MKKFLKNMKIANYWHVEIFFIVPFGIWFVWRVETIIKLMS